MALGSRAEADAPAGMKAGTSSVGTSGRLAARTARPLLPFRPYRAAPQAATFAGLRLCVYIHSSRTGAMRLRHLLPLKMP